MGLWDKLFSNKEQVIVVDQYDTVFGRFTDANKSPAQYEAWDKSVTHFENRDYQPAFEEFFQYILNNNKDNLVKTGTNTYKIYQGSKAIEISIRNGQFMAYSNVAITNQLHIGFMRRLLDLNYELKYVRYAIADDNTISLLFETSLEDASPYKLYFALKELSIHADKQDDLLQHEFDFLTRIDSGKTETPTELERKHKLNFFIESITKANALYENGKLKPEQYPSAGAYILLALLYKLDYLVRPEGKLMDRLEHMHKDYFGQNQKNILQRLKFLKNDLESLKSTDHNLIDRDLYHSVFTFGFTSPANINASFELIDRELRNIQWYVDNKYDEYIIAILEYSVGLSLFNFALPEIIKELFTVVFRISEPTFFKNIKGYDSIININGMPDKSMLRQELYKIEKKYKTEFPALVLDTKSLQFQNTATLLHSYILMIRNLQFQKAK